MKSHPLNLLRVVALLIMLGSSNAFASDFDYDYIEINNVISTDISAGGYINYSGLSIEGSYKLANNLSVTAGFEFGTYERPRFEIYEEIDIDATQQNFGLALHSAINNKIDIVIHGSLIRNVQESFVVVTFQENRDLIRDYDIGYNVQARVRYALADQIEIGANFTQVNIFEHTGNSVGAEAFLHLTSWLSVGGSYSTSQDIDTLIFKLRFLY